MIINHNMASLNTYRQMGTNMANTSRSLEKLSSGLRINKAGDDAAGLAISEKMRGQIRGLDQAARNGQDGISMLNTAEGALSETHSILQRMKELATQSANDTNTTSDRSEIQKEMNQLTSEINRIGNTTEFNTQKLLNGGGASPTTTSAVSSNGLTVPATLTAGQGITNDLATATKRAYGTIEFGAINADATLDDAKSFTVSFGDKDVNIVYDSTATASGVSGDTITIKTGNTEAGAAVAADVVTQLTAYINNDESLKGNYSVSAGAGTTGNNLLKVQASAVSMTTDGELQGSLSGGNVTIANGASAVTLDANGIDNYGSLGSHSSQTIDFSNTTAAELKGSEIVVDGKHIAFYDSADGKYEGTADFSVDLNGARTADKIVDAIVDEFAGSGAGYTNNSKLTNVFLSKTEGTKLQVTAQSSGQAGDLIEMGNNAAVAVSEVYGNDFLANEGVVSAKGLADGEHKVSISYVDASADIASTVKGTGTLASGDFTAVAVASGSDLEGGSYRLKGSGVINTVVVEKLQSDGSWSSNGLDAAYSAGTLLGAGNTSKTIGDLTFTFGAYTAGDFSAAGDDFVTFGLDAKHFEATLTEAGSDTAGTAVRVNNGQQNVELTGEDGIGSAVVNIGAFDADDVAVGDTIKWSFETDQATESTEVVGGKFQATFQIGANTAQSMTIEVNDMRAQALQISGTAAGGSVTASNGTVATFKATQEVTDGTNNTSTEFALDVSTHEKATAAISVLDDAIQSVSAERSKIGAYTNRLDHTITNLGTSSENLTAAESRVRDVDMAKEMMAFQKNNILSQAAQAMMAQANQQPQGVLQLLR